MDQRQLGKTDMQVTRLGFGLSEIGSANLADAHPGEVLHGSDNRTRRRDCFSRRKAAATVMQRYLLK